MRTCGPGYLDTIRREGRGADGDVATSRSLPVKCSRVGKDRLAAGISVFQNMCRLAPITVSVTGVPAGRSHCESWQ